MARPQHSTSRQSHLSGSHGRGSLHRGSSVPGSANRIVPPPINIPTRQHKSVTVDDFEKTVGHKKITKLDYYEEIRKKPIRILMTREISQYYGRETYLKTTIKEIIIYALFLIVLCILVLETPSSDMYMFTSSMSNIFTKHEFNTTNTIVGLQFKDVTTIHDLWAYLDDMVKSFCKHMFFPTTPQLEELVEIEGDDDRTPTNGLHENQLIGLPRIRTVRVKNDSCHVAQEFADKFQSCFGYFSASNEDTKPFGKKIGTEWNYTSSEMTGLHTVYGMVSSYGGGGFYKDCPKDQSQFNDILKNLKQANWIDRATRALIVDFTVYNANVNLFCIIKLLFEIPPTGGVIPSVIIHNLKLIDYGNKNVVLLGCVVVFIVFFVFYTIEELYEMTYFKWQFIKSFWNLLDVCIVMMCYLVIVTNLFLYVTANTHLINMENNDSKFSNFDQILYVQVVCNISMSLLVFMCWIKILKYLGINHSMYQLEATLQLASKDMLSYTIIFFTVFLAFAYLGHTLFGHQLEFYFTPFQSAWTILRAGVGDFNYSMLQQARPFLGPLYFFLLLFFMSNIFAVIYIAILLDRYAEVRSEISTTPVQMKIGDVFQNWIVDLIGTFSHKLAARARDSFNKKKMRNKFQDVRYLLMRCGFTELEINMFLAKYEISEDRVMTEEDLHNITANFQSQGEPGVGLAHEMLRHSVGEKIAAIEVAINEAEKKTAQVLSILRSLEARVSINVNK